MSVIVTNGKNRISYAIVKSLGQKGIDVCTSDFVASSMSFYSRYSKGHFLYPSPFTNPEAFIDCIIENIHRLHCSVVIPVFEETFLLAKFKEKISEHVNLVIPDYDQILIAHNKDKWMTVAEELEIPFPESYTVSDLKNGRRKTSEVKFPVLIKPKQGGGAWGILQINSIRDLANLLDCDTYNGLPWERFFVQQKLDGVVHCVATLFNHGELKGHMVYRQLRDFPFSGGQATLRESIDDPISADYLRLILERLKWHGVCQADFLVEEKTKTPYLIDINPRFWGSLIQSIASGVDFPYLLYRMAIDGDINPVLDYKRGVRTRWIWGDLRTLPEGIRCHRNKLQFIKEYLLCFGKNVKYDDFCIKDPMPFFVFGLDAASKMIKYRTMNPISHDSLKGIWE